jgi:PEP-CTERM motif
MKKSIFIAVLGLAAGVASSYGQGYIAMNSYSANSFAGFLTTLIGTSTPVDNTFSVELYYAMGTVSDPVDQNSATSVKTPVTGLTALPSSITPYDANNDGYFQGATAIIPGYTGGPITLELVASNPGWLGRSGSWTESSISAASTSLSIFGDNGVAPSFVVAPVPEPTTLALAGLGGLASLVAFRRKQA